MRGSNCARYSVDADVIHFNGTSLAVTLAAFPNIRLSMYHFSNTEKWISAMLHWGGDRMETCSELIAHHWEYEYRTGAFQAVFLASAQINSSESSQQTISAAMVFAAVHSTGCRSPLLSSAADRSGTDPGHPQHQMAIAQLKGGVRSQETLNFIFSTKRSDALLLRWGGPCRCWGRGAMRWASQYSCLANPTDAAPRGSECRGTIAIATHELCKR